VNTGELLLEPELAEWRVLSIQNKLHRWARRVRGNTGSRTAGVDGLRARDIPPRGGARRRS
jgi:RNA-directed DNA polymerase